MKMKVWFTTLFLIAFNAMAAIGDGDLVDFTPIPSEFCNSENDQKHQTLLKSYPDDIGIINIYALYLGLCRLVENGTITEQAANIHWILERTKLLEERKSTSK